MVDTFAISVDGTAVRLYRSESNGCTVHISLPKASNSIAIGHQGVAYNDGFILEAKTDSSSNLTVQLPPGDSLWAICEPGKTQSVGVLVIEY